MRSCDGLTLGTYCTVQVKVEYTTQVAWPARDPDDADLTWTIIGVALGPLGSFPPLPHLRQTTPFYIPESRPKAPQASLLKLCCKELCPASPLSLVLVYHR